MKTPISAIRHPNYNKSIEEYAKWRLTMESGDAFKNRFLEKFSLREDDIDFKCRKKITYVPSFAAAAVTEIVNAIYQRMSSIKRVGGSKTYQNAIAGLEGGVDLFGSSMNTYIGRQIIIELLSMRCVGVFVDRPKFTSNIMADILGKNPYCYIYKVEDLLCWNQQSINCEIVYTNILLRDYVDQYDEDTGLVIGCEERYRQMWLTQEGVWVQLWNSDSTPDGEKFLIPGMKRIPFILFSMNKSLLVDASGYQIALMNLSSSDLAYVLKSNFPFYVEQIDGRINSEYLKSSSLDEDLTDEPPIASKKEVKVGATHGRTYQMGTNQPDFIHPSPEPLLASMKKQEQMKDEIRQLINLSLATMKSTHASAESKGMDDRSLEGGLSAIGLELQHGENQIAKIWAMYENSEPAQVKYPETYTLIPETVRQKLITNLTELRDQTPSITFRKEVCKKIAKLTLENDVEDQVLDKIDSEIDKAGFITANADDIRNDVEAGLVDAVTASNARGYDGEKVVPLAQEEHANRLAMISEAQGGHSNGNSDLSTNTGLDGAINKNKTPSDQNPTTKKPIRGKGKNVS